MNVVSISYFLGAAWIIQELLRVSHSLVLVKQNLVRDAPGRLPILKLGYTVTYLIDLLRRRFLRTSILISCIFKSQVVLIISC